VVVTVVLPARLAQQARPELQAPPVVRPDRQVLRARQAPLAPPVVRPARQGLRVPRARPAVLLGQLVLLVRLALLVRRVVQVVRARQDPLDQLEQQGLQVQEKTELLEQLVQQV